MTPSQRLDIDPCAHLLDKELGKILDEFNNRLNELEFNKSDNTNESDSLAYAILNADTPYDAEEMLKSYRESALKEGYDEGVKDGRRIESKRCFYLPVHSHDPCNIREGRE